MQEAEHALQRAQERATNARGKSKRRRQRPRPVSTLDDINTRSAALKLPIAHDVGLLHLATLASYAVTPQGIRPAPRQKSVAVMQQGSAAYAHSTLRLPSVPHAPSPKLPRVALLQSATPSPQMRSYGTPSRAVRSMRDDVDVDWSPISPAATASNAASPQPLVSVVNDDASQASPTGEVAATAVSGTADATGSPRVQLPPPCEDPGRTLTVPPLRHAGHSVTLRDSASPRSSRATSRGRRSPRTEPEVEEARALVSALHARGPRALKGMGSAELTGLLDTMDLCLRPEDRVKAAARRALGTAARRHSASTNGRILRFLLERTVADEAAEREAFTELEGRARDAIEFAAAAAARRLRRRLGTSSGQM